MTNLIMQRGKKMKTKYLAIFTIVLLGFTWGNALYSQEPYRVGTTAMNMLEVGYGSAGIAMGDAYVASAEDASSMYWNPAGLAFMRQSEANLTMQPWLVGINTSYFSGGVVIPGVGTLGASLLSVAYGDMKVTTLDFQEGTGELFDANDFAISLGFARKITTWFSFGFAGKYASSQISHMDGSALAIDLGALVHTGFFSPTDKREDGLKIGMSIANYGSRFRYEGQDAMYPVDTEPDDNGNYQYVPAQFYMREWELPQIFRIGVSVKPLKTQNHEVLLEIDALHPNNNSESINIGGQYTLSFPGQVDLFLRGGYKGLGLVASEYSMTAGGGILWKAIGNTGLRFDYAWRDIGILGSVHSYGFGILF
jgi:hypothetical protein